MTRGNFVLIVNGEVYMSSQFNGDMYPSGFGGDVYRRLQKVDSLAGLEREIKDFDEKFFQYGDASVWEENDLDFTDDYFGRFNSDYLYIKNLGVTDYVIHSRKPSASMFDLDIPSPDVTIKPGEIQVWYFGELVKDPDLTPEDWVKNKLDQPSLEDQKVDKALTDIEDFFAKRGKPVDAGSLDFLRSTLEGMLK